MAPDERDRKFDKALARHLRSVPPAGEAAGITRVFSSQGGACPDPESLAAYHERSLLPEQMNSLKEHIVGCSNCQTILAHLEMTDEIPLQAVEQEQAFAEAALAPAAAISSQRTVPSLDARTRKSRRLLLLRGPRWQWLAPAGAIAAGLLVWIALHESPRMHLPSPNESESKMAKNEARPPIPSGALPAPRPSAPAKPTTTLTRSESAASEPAIANGRAASDVSKQGSVPAGVGGARPARTLADKELPAGKDRERDTSTDQLTVENRADLDAKIPEETLRKKEAAPVQAAKVQAENAPSQDALMQNQNNNYLSQKIPGPAPMGQMQSPAKPKSTRGAASAAPSAAPPSPPAEVGGVVSSYADTGSLIVARSTSSARQFASPGSSAIWRVGPGGLIEFSKDSGSSWSPQTSGITVDLLTGSAPSNQVCWIVGKAGAVLLTTDGGAHWKALPSPLTEDLGGVLASDALHATIWNARKTKNLVTSDGGLTWKPIPNP